MVSLSRMSNWQKPRVPDYASALNPDIVQLNANQYQNPAQIQPGPVLVVGAGGGVNSMAIQIAKLAGATVYVVAGNAEKGAMARELGADVIFDRSKVDWGREVTALTKKRGVDVVVDNVGKATINTSMKVVRRGGRIVIIGNTSGPHADIDIRYIFGKQISLIGSTMGSHQDFQEITKLLWSGKLKPVIDRVMDLSKGREAYELLVQGEHFGKIVLTP